MLDRESKREKILEAKLREIKLKQKAMEKQAAEQRRVREEIANAQQTAQTETDEKTEIQLKKSLSESE